MKTPKEKTLELVDKFLYCTIDNYGFEYAKQCALVCVDELLEECKIDKYWYWQEVKKEIKKL